MNYLCCLFCTCMSYFLVNACCNRSFESSNDLSSENLIKHNFDSVIETYKQTKTFVSPVDIPVSWEKWLKGRLAGMEADGRLLKSKTKAKKKYKKGKTKSKK